MNEWTDDFDGTDTGVRAIPHWPPPLDSGPPMDALRNGHLDLTVNYLHLQRMLEGAPDALSERSHEIQDLLDALHEVIAYSDDARAGRMLATGAALYSYVKGIFLWCDGIIEALEDACVAARMGRDSSEPRWRVVQASQFYFDGLTDPIRSDLEALGIDEKKPGEPLALFPAQVEEMFWTASWMHGRIAKSLTP